MSNSALWAASGRPFDEFQEFRQGVLQLGGVLQHFVGDAGEADDLRRQAAVGVYESLEPLGDLAVFQHHRADLRDGLPVHLQAGGLNIEADELVVQSAVSAGRGRRCGHPRC